MTPEELTTLEEELKRLSMADERATSAQADAGAGEASEFTERLPRVFGGAHWTRRALRGRSSAGLRSFARVYGN